MRTLASDVCKKVGNKQLRKFPDKKRKEVLRNRGVRERSRIEIKKKKGLFKGKWKQYRRQKVNTEELWKKITKKPARKEKGKEDPKKAEERMGDRKRRKWVKERKTKKGACSRT